MNKLTWHQPHPCQRPQLSDCWGLCVTPCSSWPGRQPPDEADCVELMADGMRRREHACSDFKHRPESSKPHPSLCGQDSGLCCEQVWERPGFLGSRPESSLSFSAGTFFLMSGWPSGKGTGPPPPAHLLREAESVWGTREAVPASDETPEGAVGQGPAPGVPRELTAQLRIPSPPPTRRRQQFPAERCASQPQAFKQMFN